MAGGTRGQQKESRGTASVWSSPESDLSNVTESRQSCALAVAVLALNAIRTRTTHLCKVNNAFVFRIRVQAKHRGVDDNARDDKLLESAGLNERADLVPSDEYSGEYRRNTKSGGHERMSI